MEEQTSAAATIEEGGDKHIAWNPKARLKLYEVDDGNRLVPYPERTPRDPAVVKLTKDKLVQRVFKDKPSRDIQVKRLEKRYREGAPCEVREELISAFELLAGLKKTIETHAQLSRDAQDAEVADDLITEFRQARARAEALMRQCGFPGMLRFGEILDDPNVSQRKKHKVIRVMNLFM
jgi:hypothetical protein